MTRCRQRGPTDPAATICYGLAGSDTLHGGASADWLDGGTGSDRMYGGLGDDTYLVDNVGDIVSEGEFSGGGYDAVLSTISYTLRLNIEFLYLTGSANLNGTGNGTRNDIFGNAGANRLTGLGGDDYLEGGNGNDVLQGGPGADMLVGGRGLDTASYAASPGAVSVGLSSSVDGSDARGDELNGIENLIGSRYSDILEGDDSANTLSGGSGNDWFWGYAGADRINGGPGYDEILYASSPTAVNINLNTGMVSGGHATGDILTSIEDVLSSPFNDVIIGNEVANLMILRTGNDTVTGNGAPDTLYGNSGQDTFRYLNTKDSNSTSGTDYIGDFAKVEDKIDLSAIDANTVVAGNQAFSFASGATVASVGIVTYDPDGWVYAANDTVAGWDLVIRTGANLALGGSDFLL